MRYNDRNRCDKTGKGNLVNFHTNELLKAYFIKTPTYLPSNSIISV